MEMTDRIYLDYQATTPVDPQVLSEMLPYFNEVFGNPHSSEHCWGWDANAAIETARREIAYNFGADTDEIFFTSGATEANNIAILGAASRFSPGKRRVLVSAIEHKTVLEAAKSLKAVNAQLEIISVDNNGEIDPASFESYMSDDVALVSVMAVNNEIGSVQKLRDLSSICHRHGAIFHTDASQALYSMDIDVYDDGIDMMSISGHKIYGPKGIGALYIHRDLQQSVSPLMYGGGQESGLRPGTLPTPMCVGLAKAISIIKENRETESEVIGSLRNEFFTKLKSRISDIKLIGPPLQRRHIGNINLFFPGVDAHLLIGAIQPNVAASSGSACTSGITGPSHVLTAIGLDDTEATKCVRFSIGRMTRRQDVLSAAEIIAAKYQALHHTQLA